MLSSQGCWSARGEDHVHLEADKFSREIAEPFILPFGGPDLDGDVLAIDPAETAESLPE